MAEEIYENLKKDNYHLENEGQTQDSPPQNAVINRSKGGSACGEKICGGS